MAAVPTIEVPITLVLNIESASNKDLEIAYDSLKSAADGYRQECAGLRFALRRAHALLERSERQIAVMSGGPGVESLAELLREAIADHLNPAIDS